MASERDLLATMLRLQAEILARKLLGHAATEPLIDQCVRRILAGEMPRAGAGKRVADTLALNSRVSTLREEEREKSKRRFVRRNEWRRHVSDECPSEREWR